MVELTEIWKRDYIDWGHAAFVIDEAVEFLYIGNAPACASVLRNLKRGVQPYQRTLPRAANMIFPDHTYTAALPRQPGFGIKSLIML